MVKLLVRLFLGLLFAVFGLFNYFTSVSENPITGERQRVALTPQEEVVLGQQGGQDVVQQFGGLYPDPALQSYVDRVGRQIVQNSPAEQSPYPFEFNLLNDPQTVNAFALPGGPIFLTTGLLRRMNSEAQLAAVLGHEIGHVVARHGSEHLARRQLGVALVNAIGLAASDDQGNGRQAAILAQAVNQVINLNYSRSDELESDRIGFDFMADANYNPEGLVELMGILNQASQGEQPPEFVSTHPNPANRIERLQALLQETYPNGVPEGLIEGEQPFEQIVQPRLR